ncbi:hypothetical protein HQN87_24010 [Paenibacillus tritici]|uniref:YNCE-like beta-propeller domain-containing protein n=1 Tax=Paenibacillus tritici TaxID=1873425 RepID=A0ABX2DUM6_9BACL|nr:hypothetical protein [Paenibacillus tritici]NQX48399.1 hypothetical protein [Paenibacillus tritici]QUL55672.1 hypothetical protein KDC22_03615 [Paenibacillus tritici]
MNPEDDHNLIEVVKTPSPDSIPDENGAWTWENTPVLPTDGVPGNGGPQSPQPPQGTSSPGSTISYNNSSTAVTLSLGTPSPWQTLETLSFINTRDREVVKLDASFMLSWTSVAAAHTFIGIDYRILRNGTQIYLSSNIFGSEDKANAKSSEQISCFHIDNPNVGNYNYTLQIRINRYTNLQPAVQIMQSELAAVVYSGILSKSYLYVSYTENLEAPNDPGFVAVVDPDNQKVIKTIRVGRSPGALAKSPDGASVYVVNVQDETVSIIDTNTHTVAATLPVGNSPTAVIVAPNNTKAYVANYGSQNVTIIDHETRQVKATVPVTGSPFAFTAQPNSWFIFAATITEGDKGHAIAISVGNDHVQDLGQNSGLDRRYNPLAAKVAGIKLMFIAPGGTRTFNVYNSNTITASYSYGLKNWTSAVHKERFDYFYGIQTFESTSRGRFRVYDNSNYVGPWNYASFTGQSHIVASPDYSRICISIEANDDQFAGLQIIDTERDSDLHFIEIPVAHKSVITSDSSLAYVMENSYVHPVDIIRFIPFESIYIGGKVHDMVAAYQMTT